MRGPTLSEGLDAGCPIADLVLTLHLGFTLRDYHESRTTEETHD